MNSASHYADRAFARSLHDPPPTLEELERLFVECQAEALRHAADTAEMFSVNDTQRTLRAEADRILRGAGAKTKAQGTIGEMCG